MNKRHFFNLCAPRTVVCPVRTSVVLFTVLFVFVPILLRAEELSRGIACLLECGDGKQAIELAADSGYLILAMDANPENVEKAKKDSHGSGNTGQNALC